MPLSRQLMRKPRILMPLAVRGVPGAYHLGRYNNTRAKPALPVHLHRGAVEICFLVRGCQTYRVGDRNYRMNGGDVFLTFPDEQHSTGGSPEEKGILYWMVLLIPGKTGSFLGLPGAQGRTLAKALLQLKSRHFRGSWQMKDHLDEITRLCHGPGFPLRGVTLAHHVIAFLLEVVAAARRSGEKGRSDSLAPVLHHIREHLGEPLSVPQLASLAGLSVARFKARFKLDIGIPPGEYVLRARVEEASRRLAGQEGTVTEIAYDLGFSTSQYFATVFKRFTGKSPRDLKNSRGKTARN